MGFRVLGFWVRIRRFMGRSDKLGVCYLEALVILVLLFRICRAPLDLVVWGFRHANFTNLDTPAQSNPTDYSTKTTLVYSI